MFRITKRSDVTVQQKLGIRFVSIILAMLFTTIFIIIVGKSPLLLFVNLFKGAFGSKYRIEETIIETIPILITSLGIMVAFKMKFWNIGAEGQIAMGAFAASYFALNFSFIPKPLLLLIMFIAAFIAGALWGVIPAFFKGQFNTNETILTLMMNYIALKWITYLQYGPWKDPKSFGMPLISKFSDNAILPKLFGVHIGWILAIILTVVIHFFLKHSKKGYEIAVIGESENTARYSGMNIKNIIIFSMILSGGIAGITGFVQASAVNKTLSLDVSGGYGFTAIITAWLSGLNPLNCAIISVLFAGLVQGGSYIQTTLQISKYIADIMQGLILFFILGSEFFIQYKLCYKRSKKTQKSKGEGLND